MKKIIIAPSLLAADFSRLAEEIARAEEGGADWIHVDVMDGHFVPNITVGPAVMASLRRTTKLPFDVHLMIENPLKHIPSFIDAGADIVTFHAEAIALDGARTNTAKGAAIGRGGKIDGDSFDKIARCIRERGKRVGMAINPETPAEILSETIGNVDMILAMTVWPGFGGQKYIDQVTEKIRRLRAMSKDVDIEVDGGLTPDTVPLAASAGANVIVAGTATFKSPSATEAIANLRKAAERASS